MTASVLSGRRRWRGDGCAPCRAVGSLLLLLHLLALPAAMGAASAKRPAKQTPTLQSPPPLTPPQPTSAAALQLHAQASGLTWGQCPGWLQEYEQWHSQALSQFHNASPATSAEPSPFSTSGQATPSGGAGGAEGHGKPVKLLLHACDEESRGNRGGCPGIGDRMNGLMESFRWAVMAKRLFLMRWESSSPLEDVLQPAAINWFADPDMMLDSIKDTQTYVWHWPDPEPNDIANFKFVNSSKTLLFLTHSQLDCRTTLPGPQIGCPFSAPPTLRSCLFHALFKPTHALIRYTADVKDKLFGPATGAKRRYVAVHLRMGDMTGERVAIHRWGNNSNDQVISSTFAAAQDLAAAEGITLPVLVVTDSDKLRRSIADNRYPGFVTTPYKAIHINSKVQPRESLITSFSDLHLLAGATCFIGSHSGFTLTALMWGRHRCFLVIANMTGTVGGISADSWKSFG